MKWVLGRQDSGYYNMLLLLSKRFHFDVYLIKIPAGVEVKKHTDPVPHAKHHRLNIRLSGDARMETRILSAIYRIGNWFTYFRPDNVVHWTIATNKNTYFLSIGWLR